MSTSREVHKAVRWLHTFISMAAMIGVLFFAVTGVTLNHPEWTFGDSVSTDTTTVELPFDSLTDAGEPDYLAVSEYLRTEYDVRGDVGSYGEVGGTASIAYQNPGYQADAQWDTATGELTLTVVQQTWVSVINDLHKGRDAGTAWKWFIDVVGIFLAAVALTGLMLQFFVKRLRRQAFWTGAVGLVIVVGLGWIAIFY